jgi:hypothetical protein
MNSKERQCVLMFDEMAIKKDFQYCSQYDLVEGFEDLGELGRSAKVAMSILIFIHFTRIKCRFLAT